MTSKTLGVRGDHVHRFARAIPNLGRIGELTRAIVEMLESNDWRHYSDATGVYHFEAGEFDYFLALHTVNARDVARLYLNPEERTKIAMAMDRARTGEAHYRRPLEEIVAAHSHVAQALTTYWNRYEWNETKYPVGARAIVRARGGVSPEDHARQVRIKRLRVLSDGWRDRVARVRAAAEGLSREEILVAIDALKEMAAKAPKLVERSRA